MQESKNICAAAFAQIDITPDYPVELVGYDRPDMRSQGVRHPLYAQVLLFRHHSAIFCLAAIDNLGLTTQLSAILRGKIARTLGMKDNSRVMLCFSHTHSAPGPIQPFLNGERYFDDLCEKITVCAAEASEKFTPCQAGWAVGKVNIGINRRAGETLTDDRLGGLKVTGENGQALAVLFRVAAHANVLVRDNLLISSDYFGPAREKLERIFGCPVILIQGGAGNIRTRCKGAVSDLDLVAEELARAAEQLSFTVRAISDIRMFSQVTTFYSDVPDRETAKNIAGQSLAACGIDGAEWLGECARLRETGLTEQTQEAEIQFLKINEGGLCGVAQEIFCEISLDVEQKLHNPLVFFNGYTNGCQGYLPNSVEWEKGGYEVLYSYLFFYRFHGRVMPYHKDTAEKLADTVAVVWEQLFYAPEKTIMQTERLVLREMTWADYPDLCEILQDKETMYAYEHAFNDEEARDWLLRQLNRYTGQGFGLWAVVLKDYQKMIGQCGLTMQDCGGRQVLEIGYLLNKSYWHKGYAIEAAAACRQYAFEQLGAQEVFSLIRPSNTASIRVAERNCMSLRGEFTKHYYGIDMPHFIFSAKRSVGEDS